MNRMHVLRSHSAYGIDPSYTSRQGIYLKVVGCRENFTRTRRYIGVACMHKSEINREPGNYELVPTEFGMFINFKANPMLKTWKVRNW
ncbi:hypothetical protein NC653_017856 [Populus alba x Populus x berolinensis]|uniref:Uncharacterized protein n=1 Tax=Populus alba x Populus x berolinensis TaxID=444605 RepID=A0AAD6QRB2_9ROSI|nr:hypothetical protein NC653_017856 [Populus alba x Populus x berolinensis]